MNYISLGYFCSVALDLERMGLRNESSPFDWVVSDFEGVITAIREHFADFLNYNYLAQNEKSHGIYKNTKYNITFHHDFDKYKALTRQIDAVQKKYARRIERFYKTITKPTCFIRYISDEETICGKSKELMYIEENYEDIIKLIKSFNPENEIVFIANNGVLSEKINIYNVPKNKDDWVSRRPLYKNSELFERFNSADTANKQENIERYQKKQKRKKSPYNKFKNRLKLKLQKTFLKEYKHNVQYRKM